MSYRLEADQITFVKLLNLRIVICCKVRMHSSVDLEPMHLRLLVGMLNLKFLQHLVVVFAIVLSLVAMKLNLLVVLELWLQLVELEQNLEILIVLQVKLCLVIIEQQILLGQFVLYLGQRLL